MTGDYDGDGKTDIAVYRQNGVWDVRFSADNYVTGFSYPWGLKTDIPVPGDYDGDGKTDLAVFRPSDGVWYILKSSSNFASSIAVSLGSAADIPVQADFDGDGITDLSVYHSGVWEIRLSTLGYAGGPTITWGLPTDLPFTGDFDGDGKADLALWRRTVGWFVLRSSTNYSPSADADLHGALTYSLERPTPGDFDGDGITDLGSYRTDGTWGLPNSSTGSGGAYGTGASTDLPISAVPTAWLDVRAVKTALAQAIDFDGDGRDDLTLSQDSTSPGWHVVASSTAYVNEYGLINASYPFVAAPFPVASDRPVPGDYDGDGRTDFAVYHPNGAWDIRFSSGRYDAGRTISWGLSSDIPVPGDYDGDGFTDIAVYRPAEGKWYILRSNGLNWYYVNQVGYTVQFGGSTDRPVPGDYDGDGITDLAIYHTSGLWEIRYSSANFTSGVSIAWGLNSDIPVPGDYDGDGRTDLGIYRPSEGTWYVLSSSNYTTHFSVALGTNADRPVPGDYDGDGKTEVAILEPSGRWRILYSHLNYTSGLDVQWGSSTDVPVVNDYWR